MSALDAFVECPSCKAKPGSPVLCPQCLERRALYTRIDQLLQEASPAARRRLQNRATQPLLVSLSVSTHYESNGEAGDGQTVCDGCGRETDEGHGPEACIAYLHKDVPLHEHTGHESCKLELIEWLEKIGPITLDNHAFAALVVRGDPWKRCVRCAAPYAVDGYCSRRHSGPCQGAVGEWDR